MIDNNIFTNRPRPKDGQQVKIVIFPNNNRNKHIVVNDLDRNKTLEDTRKYLVKIENKFVGWQNTIFRNAYRKIPKSCEDNYKVEDILVPDEDFYCLQVEIDEKIPCVPELFRNLKIDRGYKKNNDGSIIKAKKLAFSINNLLKNFIIRNKLETIVKDTNQNCKQFWLESFQNDRINKGDKLIESCNEEKIELNKYTIRYCQKGTIQLSFKDVEATEEYIKAIKDALDPKYNDDKKRENLKDVGDDYGFFTWQEFELGGKFLDMAQNQSKDEPYIVGGNHDMYGNPSNWIGSLESYKTWE
ncbi:14409_t:CDS:2, partial [Dentiscutata heterogama]